MADIDTSRCPLCNEIGKKVRAETINNLVNEKLLPAQNEDYYLCPASECEVVYFGQHIYYKDDVKLKVWFKEQDPTVPVCYCKGITTADIFEHVAVRSCCKNIKDIQLHTGANTGSECLTKNPAGT